ncbi:MAG: TorF family putative porin [Bacteroidota bacterium]|nr:TorF family putative porin [Bacteroidota bacterium]
MKKLFNGLFLALAMIFCLQGTVVGQGFNVGSDFVSRYVWRGMDFANSPSIQPTLSYTATCGFEIGYWGAYSTNAINYQETDLYLSYTIKDVIKLGVTDYFFPMGDSLSISNKYFEYGEDKTGHILEGSLTFNGLENFPVYLSLNYNFYGADKDNSFYGEIGYNGTAGDYEYSVFLGATPGKGIYLPDGSDEFSVVNVGLTASKEIRITEKFSLPVMGSLVFNPQSENIFLVFGFSL